MAHAYKYMMPEDYKKLTVVQKRILEKMRTENLILAHTEGRNTRCWLETYSGERKDTVRIDTANAIFSLGAIQSVDHKDVLPFQRNWGISSLFYNTLTPRFLELHKRYSR